MEAKKIFTYLRLVLSVIFSIYLFRFVVIIWTYIPTNSTSVHHTINLTDLRLSEYENLNVRIYHSYRLPRLGDRCITSKNGNVFVDIAILATFLDKQHSSVQQCDQFICPAVFSCNERSLSSVVGKSTCASVHWTHQPSATSHHMDFVMVTYCSAFS